MNLRNRMDADTLDLAASYAHKGAAFLDEIRPGWDDTVNLTNLKLASSMSCVLGQVYDADALAETQTFREKASLRGETWYAQNPKWRISGYDYASDALFDGDTTELVEHGFLSETETCGCDVGEHPNAAYYCDIHDVAVNDRDLIGYAHLDVVWSELISARYEQRAAYETYAENIAFSEGYEDGYFDGQRSMLDTSKIKTVTDIVARFLIAG